MEELFGELPAGTGAEVPAYKKPQEIRFTKVNGGFLINKFGEPLEVTTDIARLHAALDEVIAPAADDTAVTA
jgi:hypothetical protein